jgi:competence protein ComEC
MALRESIVKPGINDVEGITGILLDDPRVSAYGSGFGKMRLLQSAAKGGLRSSAKGKLTVYFPLGSIPKLKEFGRGSTIYVDGSFGENSRSGEPVFRAKSCHIIKAPGTINRLRTKVRLSLIKIFSCTKNSKEWGGFSLALLLGITDNLDSNLSLQYKNAGCSHILSLSGMHLAIVSSIIAFLLKRPLGLKAAAVLGAVFTIIYVFLVGAQPSLIRSAFMYVLGTFAILFSLPRKALQILALSFLLQIITDPKSGLSISFILSYLSLAGILLLTEGITACTRGMLPDIIAQPLSASIGAFASTLSVSAFFFGSIRLVGIVAGLILVPLTTLFMIVSIIFLAFYFIIPPLTVPLDFVLLKIYNILEYVANFSGKIPAITITNIPVFVIISSLVPFALLYLCDRRSKIRCKIDRFD